jgi:hypothetical protein
MSWRGPRFSEDGRDEDQDSDHRRLKWTQQFVVSAIAKRVKPNFAKTVEYDSCNYIQKHVSLLQAEDYFLLLYRTDESR